MLNHVLPDQLAHDLRGRDVLRGTNLFKQLFFSWIDQDRQSCCAVFHGGLVQNVGLSYN